jgi:hypothetical protein
VWFTENAPIGRITPDGRVTLFPVPGMVQLSAATAKQTCYCYPGIVRGAEGACTSRNGTPSGV